MIRDKILYSVFTLGICMSLVACSNTGVGTSQNLKTEESISQNLETEESTETTEQTVPWGHMPYNIKWNIEEIGASGRDIDTSFSDKPDISELDYNVECLSICMDDFVEINEETITATIQKTTCFNIMSEPGFTDFTIEPVEVQGKELFKFSFTAVDGGGIDDALVYGYAWTSELTPYYIYMIAGHAENVNKYGDDLRSYTDKVLSYMDFTEPDERYPNVFPNDGSHRLGETSLIINYPSDVSADYLGNIAGYTKDKNRYVILVQYSDMGSCYDGYFDDYMVSIIHNGTLPFNSVYDDVYDINVDSDLISLPDNTDRLAYNFGGSDFYTYLRNLKAERVSDDGKGVYRYQCTIDGKVDSDARYNIYGYMWYNTIPYYYAANGNKKVVYQIIGINFDGTDESQSEMETLVDYIMEHKEIEQ